jgi:ABC-type protease/lipase transport system fused ATPase/permease subunit
MGKILRVLLGLVEKLTEYTPLVGDVIENVKSKDGGVGRFFAPRFIKQIIRLVLVALGAYLVIKGDITVDELESFTN